MKKSIFLLLGLFLTMTVMAQPQADKQKFNPEWFTAEMHKFIANEAGLTQQEAAAFFPVFDEMKTKERCLFNKQRKKRQMPQTDVDIQKAVEEYDQLDLDMKKIQQCYHKKFFKVLPAEKVFKVIRADDRFKTQMFRNMAGNRRMKPNGQR